MSFKQINENGDGYITKLERNHEQLTSTLFLLKVTFFDFSIEFFIRNKNDEWF